MKRFLIGLSFVFFLSALRGNMDLLLEPIFLEEVEALEPLSITDLPAVPQGDFVSEEVLVSADIKNDSILLDETLLLAEIEKSLRDQFAPVGDLKIFLERTWKPIPLERGNWAFEMIKFPHNGLQSTATIKFRIYNDGSLLNDWYVPIRCELWREGFLSRMNIAKEEALRPSMFTLRRIDVLRQKVKIVTTDTNLSPYELAKSVKAGKLLEWEDVQGIPVVRKGQLVNVIAREGVLNIQMKGSALDSGAAGEIITIRNVVSNNKIQGEIIDDKTVRVYF